MREKLTHLAILAARQVMKVKELKLRSGTWCGLNKINRFHIVVRPAGFEPATPWFEAKYSNPLSYGRISSIRLTDREGETKLLTYSELFWVRAVLLEYCL